MLTDAGLRRLSAALAHAGEDEGADGRRSRGTRRTAGAYFTPAPLVRFVIAEVIRARARAGPIEWGADGAPALRVVDPAAGDGRFLVEAADQLAARAAARGFDRESARRAIARRCVFGVERDPEFAAIARAALGAPASIAVGEALLDPPEGLRAPADLVVGNPPYVRSIRLGETDGALRDALRGRYAATSYGEWDLYAAFLEQALAWAAPAGEIGLVVPSRWLTAAFATKLRAALAEARAVRAIVDFGSSQIFGSATTYASVAFLSRRPRRRVAVARLEGGAWERGALSAARLDGRPWRVGAGAGRGLLARLSRGPALGEVARVVKGAGTNADRVFALEEAELRGDRARGYSRALGRRVEVEAEITAPCARGREIRPYGALPPTRCVLPYDGAGALLPPARLEARFPLARDYFEACREPLEARERGRFAGPRYYAFGRPQNLAFLTDPTPKVVFPDVAREGRALWDERGTLLLDTAYAARPRPGSVYPLAVILAAMNSPILILWLRETGVRLRGDYVRLKTAYLRDLPLPPPSRHTAAIERGLAGGAGGPARLRSRGEVEDLLRRAYGVSAAEWRAIGEG